MPSSAIGRSLARHQSIADAPTMRTLNQPRRTRARCSSEGSRAVELHIMSVIGSIT